MGQMYEKCMQSRSVAFADVRFTVYHGLTYLSGLAKVSFTYLYPGKSLSKTGGNRKKTALLKFIYVNELMITACECLLPSYFE